MKFLVIDTGIFAEQANALADGSKNEVIYCSNWQTAFPKWQDYVVGLDFEYLQKEKYFWDWVDWADVIVNFDVLQNDMIAWLRKNGYVCFGSGYGERLEDERYTLKQVLEEVDLPMQDYKKLRGITELTNYLKKNKEQYIKLDIFRNDVESFYAKDDKAVERIIKDIDGKFGPFSEDFEFISEETIESEFEFGVDTFFNGEDYIKPYFYGVEYDKGPYIGRVVDELPKPLQETMDKLRPVLKKLDWRGAISTEEKIVSEKEHYFLDICARLPAPLGLHYSKTINNWPEVVSKIAHKETVEIDIDYPYVAIVPFTSNHAKTNWVKLILEKGAREGIRFYSIAAHKDNFYAPPGEDCLGVAIGQGNTIDEAIDEAKRYAKKVDAYGLDCPVEGLDKIKEIIKKAKSIGIDF